MKAEEKAIWNDAVRATLVEVARWDGLMSQGDRQFLVDEVQKKIAYLRPEIKPVDVSRIA